MRSGSEERGGGRRRVARNGYANGRQANHGPGLRRSVPAAARVPQNPALVSQSASVPTRWPPPRRILLYLLVTLLFAAGVGYLGLRHYFWPRLDQWRPMLEARLTDALGKPVSIAEIRTGFDGLLPRLSLERVRVLDADGGAAAEAARVTAVLSPRTLFAGEPRLALLELEAPVLRVERLQARLLRVAGFDLPLDESGDGRLLAQLLAQRRIVIRDAVIDWHDALRDVSTRLSGVGVTIGSVGRRHRLDLDAGALEGAWAGLRFAAEFHRAANAPAFAWRRWDGESYLAVEGGDAAAIVRLFPLPEGPVASARGDLKAWLDFDHGRARRADLKTALRELDLGLPEGRLRLAQLHVELTTRAQGDGHDLRVQRLEAQDPQGLRLAASGEQRIRLDAQGSPVAGRLSVAPFDAGQALRFARRLPLAPQVLARLAALEASGRITAASGQWDRAAGLRFESAVDFEALALRYAPPGQALPWFSNLSGQARITQSDGEVRVRSSGATLAFPGIFAEPEIALRSLSARASWTVGQAPEPAGTDAQASSQPPIEVRIAELRFENPDAAGVVSGHWRNGGKSAAGIVDLEGRLERARAERAVRYLPLQIPAEVRDWVGEAVTAGRSDDVRLRLRGDLADFPFIRPADGEFSVDARLAEATLHYAPGWPAIERFEGKLLFERNGMKVTMRSGRVYGVTLGQTQAVLQDFHVPLLVVEGLGDGPAADMIRFVNDSPVATRIDDFTRDVQAQGPARLNLRLELPLDHLDRSRVAGRVSFLGNTLTLDSTLPPLSGVTGALEFSEQGLALKDVSAGFLGGSLRVNGETPQPGRFAIRGEGRIAAEGLRTVADNPITRALSGETAYRAQIDVQHRASSVTVESDLEGLASALPAPLGKAAGERMPLRVQTTAAAPASPDARPAGDSIAVALGEGLRLALEREREPRTEKLLVRRGVLALNAPAELPEAGLAVHLNAPEVDLDAWSPVFSGTGVAALEQAPREGFAEGFSLLPQAVSVVAERVRVAGRDLHAVVLGASRVGGQWRANIRSREVQGYFGWREAAPGQRIGTLTARFTRLELPRSRAAEVESLLESSPQALPALDVSAEEFVLFDRRLGSLSLRAVNSAGGARPVWTLEQLRIEHPSAVFDAHGTWAPVSFGSGRATQLAFGLDIADAGRLLALYGVEEAVRGGAGRISGELHWSGSPLAFDYTTLGGQMRMQIGKGQFLKTDPGIAKLIGVLNLQSLPRRLALDFRDVFAEGFAFDEIAGDIGISRGVAHTGDLKMRGVQAEVHIRGSADLGSETQALEVEVRPELNAGLASLAYGAMVNPVIGLGSFVAQLALRGPIQQIFSYEYEISGSWADPKVVEKRRPVPPAALPGTPP